MQKQELEKILNLNTGLILVAIFLAFNIYKSQAKDVKKFREKIDTETKINELLVTFGPLEKKMAALTKLLYKPDASFSISTINKIGEESGVDINSIKPMEERLESEYIVYSFSLVINTDDYDKLGTFISKIESSSDIYTIETLNIRPFYGAKGVEQFQSFTVDMVLNTISIKV